MKTKTLLTQLTIIISILSFVSNTNAADTLYTCAGNAIQLQATSNQYSYNWLPVESMSDTSISNPFVSPDITTTYISTAQSSPNTNLIHNGDFSLGNTGFSSDYLYTSDGTLLQGFYGIFSTPTDFNSWFSDCSDHSEAPEENMFIADGALALDQYAWCQQVAVTPNNMYTFSGWVTNIFWESPPLIQFSINGSNLGDAFQVPTANCIWEEVTHTWNSLGNTTANICVETISTNVDGNDFAMDDISFTVENETYRDTFVVIVLDNTSSQIEASACANEFVTIDGFEFSAGAIDSISYSAYNGCDSIVFVNVASLDTAYSETRVDTLCLGDTLFYQGLAIVNDTSICDTYSSYNGCDSSICFVVYFLSEGTINIEMTQPSCTGQGDGILLASPFAGVPPYNYLWSNSNSSAFVQDLTSGYYTVTVTDVNGCSAERQIFLEDPLPLLIQHEITEPSCYGLDGNLEVSISGGDENYVISFENYFLNNNTFTSTIPAGEYTITAMDGNGCLKEEDIVVNEPEPIEISLAENQQIALGHPFEIETSISANYPYDVQWLPAAHLSCANCEQPITTTSDDIDYQIVVEDINGCKSKGATQINVKNNFELFIPDAFSPNFDGVNDYFEIYTGPSVKQIKSFRIFNRWGALVFQSDNFKPGAVKSRWDGTFKGVVCSLGNFVYLAEVIFINEDVGIFEGEVLLVK